MIRVLFFLAALAALGLGFAWVAEQPGEIALTWHGTHYEVSLITGFVTLLLTVVALTVLWTLVRFVFRIPALVSLGHKMRRREKALVALTRGMIAAGAGDVKATHKAALQAQRHLPHEPLTLLLRAQSAQLKGDRAEADALFARMAEREDMRLLGLRGLHVEALRRGDPDAAHHFAAHAHRLAPVDWAGKAVLDHHAAREDWDKALAAVDANLARKLLDKATAQRQRAVIKSAQALELGDGSPETVLELALSAVKLAPDLVPAVVLAGRALARKGDVRKASKILEAGWVKTAHPDIAAAYLDVRPGDSATDRLTRAETLARLHEHAPESRLQLARAALDARDFVRARETLAPLLAKPETRTRRLCLLMAMIEETEHGATGALRAWLSRATRAAADATWLADGQSFDTWAPIAPVSRKLDGFTWGVPVQNRQAIEDPALDHEETAPASSAPVMLLDQVADVAEVAPAPAPVIQEPMSPEPEVVAKPADQQTPSNPLNSKPVGHKPVIRPVMFPQPPAPDDPGPKKPAKLAADGEVFD